MVVRRVGLLLELLQIAKPPAWWLWFEVPGAPQAKERARWAFTRDGKPFAYTPTATRRAEKALAQHWRVQLGQAGLKLPLRENLAVVALFAVESAKREDGDNLLKLAIDAGTAGQVWLDDSQVTASASWIELWPGRARTVIGLAPHDSTRRLRLRTRAPKARQGTLLEEPTPEDLARYGRPGRVGSPPRFRDFDYRRAPRDV